MLDNYLNNRTLLKQVSCFFAIVLSLMVASSVYELFARHSLKKGKRLHPLLTAFSVITNGRSLLAISKSSKNISCLHGLRTISIVWVVFAHVLKWHSLLPSKNLFEKDWDQTIFLVQHDLIVDTFLLMSGLLVSYGYIMSSSKGKDLNIIMFYFHRYLRLTPILAIQMIIDTNLVEYLGNGPMWNTVQRNVFFGCREHWWRILIYVQNYTPFIQCVNHAWYLAVDMQLYLLSPLLLIPLVKWPKLGKIFTGSLIAGSILSCFYIAYIFRLSFSPANEYNFLAKYYLPTYTRASTWLIGFVLGDFIYSAKRGKHYITSKVLKYIFWVASVLILIACFYGRANIMGEYKMIDNIIHMGLVRPAWSVAVSWIILECVMECPLNWFLSLPAFEVLGKLTYSIYIIHPTMFLVIASQLRVASYVTVLSAINVFCGILIFSVGTSVLYYLAIESPIAKIQSYAFESK